MVTFPSVPCFPFCRRVDLTERRERWLGRKHEVFGTTERWVLKPDLVMLPLAVSYVEGRGQLLEQRTLAGRVMQHSAVACRERLGGMLRSVAAKLHS